MNLCLICSDGNGNNQFLTVELYLFLVSGESEEHLWKHEEPSRSNASLRQPHLQERQQSHLGQLIPRLRTHTGKNTHTHTHTHTGHYYTWTKIILMQRYVTFYLPGSEHHYLSGLSCFSDQHDFFRCCYYIKVKVVAETVLLFNAKLKSQI